MKRFVVGALLALSFVIIAGPGPAAAQALCGPREELLPLIVGPKYAEALVARGLAGDVVVLEVYVSATGETWTILETYPDGNACIRRTGEDWTAIEPVYGQPS